MVPVTRLPDLCLLALFRQMTLEDQIKARKVCSRWADLVPEANIKRRELILLLGGHYIETFEDQIDWALFCERQALKLLLKADGTPMYPAQRFTSWNSLHLDSLNQTSASQIASTFIGAKKLQVAVNSPSPSTVDSLAHLLELWSHQLLDLQFFESPGYYSIDNEPITSSRLFAAINAQSALKKLHLHLYYMPVPDLSIISQLEELHFHSDSTNEGRFAQWLQQYGEGNRNLARIEYDTNCCPVLKLFTALSEPLRHCFTRLQFTINPDPVSLCVHFTSLTTLHLSPARLTPRQLFTHLATLRQLIYLNLAIQSDTFLGDLEHHHYLLPQVKSVKALELKLWWSMPVHQQLAKMKFAWTLPAVEVIRFQLTFLFNCTECSINNLSEPSEQAKSCLRKLFASLKRDCTKLRLIKHDVEQVHGTAEELLAE